MVLEFIKSWPWQEFLATIIGAVFAFFLPTYYEYRRKKRQQRQQTKAVIETAQSCVINGNNKNT